MALYAPVALAASQSNEPYLDALAFVLGVYAGLQTLEFVLGDLMLRRRFGVDIPRLILDLLNTIVVIATVVFVIATLRRQPLDIGHVLLTSTVVSAVLGFALQEVLGNILAGLALQAEAPFKTGEWVRVMDREGQIVQTGWRTVTLRTRENILIRVPNGAVAREPILNFDEPSSVLAINVYVGVSYNDPPERVKAVIKEAALSAPGVLAMPAPVIFVEDFQDFAVRYRARLWIDDYARMPEIKDGVHSRIWYALRRNDMTIPVPIRDVRLRQAAADADQAVDAARTAAATALRRLPLFEPLSDDQIERLAAAAEALDFAPGEVLLRQGAVESYMLAITSGTARIEVTPEDAGPPVALSVRGAGDVVGEMSLLTGEPRTATVVAESEVSTLRVEKPTVAAILAEQPDVADRLSLILAQRATDLEERLADRARMATHEQEEFSRILLRRIHEFFALEPTPPRGAIR